LILLNFYNYKIKYQIIKCKIWNNNTCNQIKVIVEPSRWWPVVRAWDQEICSLYGLGFEPCGCSYDSHWKLTWSLTSGPVGLVKVRASWPNTHVKLKKKKLSPIILTGIRDFFLSLKIAVATSCFKDFVVSNTICVIPMNGGWVITDENLDSFFPYCLGLRNSNEWWVS
jgi:hypothetical protein